MDSQTPLSWDYRRLSIRTRPGEPGPDLEPGAVERLLRTVHDMEHLERKGWRLVSIACQEEEPGLQCYQVVLKRPRAAAATGQACVTASHAMGAEEASPSSAQSSGDNMERSSRRRAA